MENTDILDEYQKHDSTGGTDLYVPVEAYNYLNMAAKWGNILAIIGFVMTGLGALAGLIMVASVGFMASMSGIPGFAALMWIALILYFGILAFYVVPLLHLIRFSKSMKTALEANDQVSLATSFENLGKLFRFLGILTVVIIGIYILMYIVIGALSASMASSLQNF